MESRSVTGDVEPTDFRWSPVQCVVNAVAAALGSGQISCFIDCDQRHLETLAGLLGGSHDGSTRLLLVKTPFRIGRLEAWAGLIESVVKASGDGIVANLDNVVASLKLTTDCFPSGTILRRRVTSKNVIEPSVCPRNFGEVSEARKHLLMWAQVESLAQSDYAPTFSPLIGGVRPIIVVLDDYNNYIQITDHAFYPLSNIPEPVVKRYGDRARSGDDDWFPGILKGYCQRLNNLSIAYEVIAPKLWIEGRGYPDYRSVAIAVPFQDLDRIRERIGAFVVDLEWRPSIVSGGEGGVEGRDAKWGDMGYRAIHLLSTRYPEIPCFVYTGEWSLGKLQEALAHGAAWCFRKTDSHHGYASNLESPELTSMELERHLRGAVNIRYGSFSELPYSDQLQIDPKNPVGAELLKRLAVKFPIGQCPKGKSVLNLIAKMFPDGSSIRPVKVLSSGRSKAQATFFASPSRAGSQLATRFLKIARWPEIQKEYLAYATVIKPRLNSYVANIVDKPIVADGLDGEMPMGAVVYSMAGFPEGHKDLRSLDDLLKDTRVDPASGNLAAKRLRDTLKHVLEPLYSNTSEGTLSRQVVRKPLWAWLGEILPPVHTGVLIPLEQVDEDLKRPELSSYLKHGYKNEIAWHLASYSLQASGRSDDNLSPWHDDFSKAHPIVLAEWSLLEAEWGNGPQDSGQITLAHPDLGLRIRLRGQGADIRRRFGAGWVRPGLPVRVAACIDPTSLERERIALPIESASRALGCGALDDLLGAFRAQSRVVLKDPFEVFCGGGLPHHFTIEAHAGPIHGDLNLGNLLFAGSDGPGWLIDFECAREQGMQAYDLAKLEVEICRFHLFPLLEELAAVFPDEKGVQFKLLHWAHLALRSPEHSEEVFESNLRSFNLFSGATENLLVPLRKILRVIAEVRVFCLRHLRLLDSELQWALAAYYFISTKFFRNDQQWPIAFGFLSAAYHLGFVAPDSLTTGVDQQNLFDEIVSVTKSPKLHNRVDGFLLKTHRTKPSAGQLAGLCVEMARPARGKAGPTWPTAIRERWDFASTGSVANITPLFGYLWLMVKATQGKRSGESSFSMAVPKISSKGTSCGTVDILETGGLTFPNDPAAIVKECRRVGGVLCRQDAWLTPIDKVLMERRKATNTMKDVVLTLSSILSKKLAMGCTHAIIDVKIGKDTKIIAPWMGDDYLETFLTGVGNENLIVGDTALKKFQALLSGLFSEDEALIAITGNWLQQKIKSDKLASLKEIGWILTNANVPQCRAIGRQLVLLHLDDLILGANEERLLEQSNHFRSLYRELLPEVCGIDDRASGWRMLQSQWTTLRARLTRLPGFIGCDTLNGIRIQADQGYATARRVRSGVGEELHDLLHIAFGAVPYAIPVGSGPVGLKSANAYALDALFEWLCGPDSFDPEVGIWLHKLPGETVSFPATEPLISVFFRPSRTSEREVIHRVRSFLADEITVA